MKLQDYIQEIELAQSVQSINHTMLKGVIDYDIEPADYNVMYDKAKERLEQLQQVADRETRLSKNN